MAKTKKASQSEHSRAVILDATMDLISKHGFSGTTVDKIAADAGLSKGSIFWHFNNKETLFLAVIEAIRDGLFKALLAGQHEGLSTKERVSLLFENYAGEIEKDYSRCLDLTVLIIEMVETNPGLAEALRDLFAQLTDVFISFLEEGKQRGEIAQALDSEATAYAVAGNLQGMTVQYYLNRDKLEYSRLMAAYKNLVLNGLFPQ